MTQRRLFRSRQDYIIAGVAGGVAQYFGMDPTLVRLVWVVACLAGGAGLFLYLTAWVIVPPEPGPADNQWFDRVEAVRQLLVTQAKVMEARLKRVIPGAEKSPEAKPHDDFEPEADGEAQLSTAGSEPKEPALTGSQTRSQQRTGGLTLVIVGAILLLRSQLPFFDLSQVWPTLLVGAGSLLIINGLRRRKQPPAAPKRYLGSVGQINTGAALATIGLVMIMIRIGVLDRSIWESLFRLWPWSLVAAGLHLWLRSTRLWAIPVFLVVGVVLWSTFLGQLPTRPRTITAQGPIESNVMDARLRLNLGAGSLYLAGGAVGSYDAVFTLQGRDPAQKMVRTSTGVAIDISQRDPRVLRWVRGLSEDWLIRLNENLLYDIAVEAGTVSMDLDLRGLDIRSLDINCSASDIDIYVGENRPRTDIFISTGASRIRFYVPRSVGVRFRVDSVLSDTNLLQQGFVKRDNEYVTRNYVEALNTLDVYVASALARVEVRYLD